MLTFARVFRGSMGQFTHILSIEGGVLFLVLSKSAGTTPHPLLLT